MSEFVITIEGMFDFDVASIDPQADEAVLIARIADLERLKSAAAAGQARAAAALDARRRTAEAEAGVPAGKRGRSVAGEVALARRDSPARGNRHLGFAKALVYEMPHTLAALAAGLLSEWRATLIVRACLGVGDRRALDAELCGDPASLEGVGDARLAAAAKAIAYRLDPQAVGGPGGQRGDRAQGDDPSGARHHDVVDRPIARRPRRLGVCGAAPRGGHHPTS